METEDINKIIPYPITDEKTEQIWKDYENGKYNYVERMLLCSLEDAGYFRSFLKGLPPYNLSYDSSIPEDSEFTNVESLLDAFYSLYEKMPDFHFDQLLEMGLGELSRSVFSTYECLAILEQQLKNEKDKTSPFVIKSVPILEQAKEQLKDERLVSMLRRSKKYLAKNKENGLLDLVKEYNETFKKEKGVDIFDK